MATRCPHQQQALVNVVCYNCGKPGQIQRNCPNPPIRARDAPYQPTTRRMFTIAAPDVGSLGDVVEGKE